MSQQEYMRISHIDLSLGTVLEFETTKGRIFVLTLEWEKQLGGRRVTPSIVPQGCQLSQSTYMCVLTRGVQVPQRDEISLWSKSEVTPGDTVCLIDTQAPPDARIVCFVVKKQTIVEY